MTKKDRVRNAIALKPVDYVPCCFSLHFPKEISRGEEAVKAHLDFFRQSDTDILKIMNENLVMGVGEMKSFDDYGKIPTISMKSPFMADQIELTKRILDKCDGDCYTVGTLHGICASALHPFVRTGMPYEEARKFQAEAIKSGNPKVRDAFSRIADGMCELAEAYINAGVDGIYYAALGGEPEYFDDDSFDKWMRHFDKMIMTSAKSAGGDVFLHICKEKVNVSRYADYVDTIDVANWGVYEVPCPLEEGSKYFPGKAIMGGLANRSGLFVDGDCKSIEQEVHRVIRSHGTNGFILGADCTLATEQDMELLKAAVEACRTV